jgi:hypothetical protein
MSREGLIEKEKIIMTFEGPMYLRYGSKERICEKEDKR